MLNNFKPYLDILKLIKIQSQDTTNIEKTNTTINNNYKQPAQNKKVKRIYLRKYQ